ncbi:hypothetical protein HF520_07170 [Romboutsia sp. CE17]|uniref:hypothetical protein n=1 Tax=Romboutsia sp. CE17 TaxID=2724150 RepID=UPI001442C9E9|nr:hypothetical protein [Romboutsia sp. CE17]QJA08739.1 hypothetical protein HF520_07170 [Romboutsia sp. CE17]
MEKKKSKEREELDNNKVIKELLKENDGQVEIANEISTNKKVADVLGDRLARKRHFPPC